MSNELFYKRDVNKSVLWDGFGIEREYLDIFLSRISPLKRGEKCDITIILNNKPFLVEIKNLNNPIEKRINDAYQIRYPANGELAKELQHTFYRTFNFIQEAKQLKQSNGKKRFFTSIPDECKEYIAFYTTNNPTVFQCEPIILDDVLVLKEIASSQSERIFESEFNYDVHDDTAGISTKQSLVRIRKLNKKIGDTLKNHYNYRCQICGKRIGSKYDSNVVESHHIDYFVKSLNNDITNLLIVCPNHHSIIHDKNPVFDRTNCIYTYPNGFQEGLLLNDHLIK